MEWWAKCWSSFRFKVRLRLGRRYIFTLTFDRYKDASRSAATEFQGRSLKRRTRVRAYPRTRFGTWFKFDTKTFPWRTIVQRFPPTSIRETPRSSLCQKQKYQLIAQPESIAETIYDQVLHSQD